MRCFFLFRTEMHFFKQTSHRRNSLYLRIASRRSVSEKSVICSNIPLAVPVWPWRLSDRADHTAGDRHGWETVVGEYPGSPVAVSPSNLCPLPRLSKICDKLQQDWDVIKGETIIGSEVLMKLPRKHIKVKGGRYLEKKMTPLLCPKLILSGDHRQALYSHRSQTSLFN